MKTKMQTIPPEVIEVLKRSGLGPDFVRLPEQLDRKLYEQVMKTFKASGGKWEKKTGVHRFPCDPREWLTTALDTGKVLNKQQTFQSFYTPKDLAAKMAEMASVEGYQVLEPSCGSGSLVRACLAAGASQVAAVDIDGAAYEEARHWPKTEAYHGDFLEMTPTFLGLFPRIVMNPPFSRGDDIKHIKHAITFLGDRGKLVGLCADGDKQAAAIKPMCSTWTPLGPGMFKEAGTNISVVLFHLFARRTETKARQPEGLGL